MSRGRNVQRGVSTDASDREPKPKGRLTGDLLEKVIVGALSIFLVSGVTYYVTNTWKRIDKLEANVAKHHGPEWQTIDKIIGTMQLKNEFIGRVGPLEAELDHAHVVEDALKLWTAQFDAVSRRIRQRESQALAFYSERVMGKAVTINTAHPRGGFFAVGNVVQITNLSDHTRPTTEGSVAGTYTDLDNSDVLIQVGDEAARQLSFSLSRGKVKVSVTNEDAVREWKTFSELLANLGDGREVVASGG
jgi:hypothetical protein